MIMAIQQQGIFTFLKNDIVIHDRSNTNKFYQLDLGNKSATNLSLGLDKVNRLERLISFNNHLYAIGDFTLTLGNLTCGWISFQNTVFV